MKKIEDWLQYQIIHSEIETKEIQNSLDLKEVSHLDFEEYSILREEKNQAVCEFALQRYSDFNPTTQTYCLIKELWLEILEQLIQSNRDEIQLDIGDYEYIAELHEKIDELNLKIEQQVIVFFKLQHPKSKHVKDWFNLKDLSNQLDILDTKFAESHVQQLISIELREQENLSYQFLLDRTEHQLDLYKNFTALSQECVHLIQLKMQLCKLQYHNSSKPNESVILNHQLDESLEQISTQIKSLEVELKIHALNDLIQMI